jgi:ABC-type multidrug transport system fused ATPase/permease subunit
MQVTFPNTIYKFIQYFFKPYRTFFVIMILINIFVAAYVTLEPYVIKKLIDAATPLLGKRSLIKATLLPASLLVLLSILNNLSWRLNNYRLLDKLTLLKGEVRPPFEPKVITSSNQPT